MTKLARKRGWGMELLITFLIVDICCRLYWISGQNDFKLVWFVFPLFYCHYHQTKTKKNTNQTSLRSFWPEIHFKLQHIRHQNCWPKAWNFLVLKRTRYHHLLNYLDHWLFLKRGLKRLFIEISMSASISLVLRSWPPKLCHNDSSIPSRNAAVARFRSRDQWWIP